MKRALTLLPAAAVAVAVTSCGTSNDDAAANADPAKDKAPTSKQTPKTQTLTAGHSVTVTTNDTIDESDSMTAKVTLDKVYQDDGEILRDDPDMFGKDPVTPDRGQFVGLDLSIENVGDTKGTWLPNVHYVSDDGKRFDLAGASVSPYSFTGEDNTEEMDNLTLDADQHSDGVWMFDVPNDKGTIVVEETPAVEILIKPAG